MADQPVDTQRRSHADERSGDWQDRLSVIVPAFNEQDGIAAVLEDLRRVMPRAEIIVIDDGSTDGTAARAEAVAGITLIRHVFNRGYGSAIKTGAAAATGEYIAWFDADSQHRAEDLALMTERLENERLAAVIGQRRNPARSMLRSVGKLMMRLLARALNAGAVRDLNCGLRVFRRDVLLTYLNVLPEGFSASTTTTMILFARGYPTGLQPVTLNPRIGASKVVFADGIAALTLIVRIVMLVAPLRIFMRAGLALLVVGLAYGVEVALREKLGFPVAGVVMIISGVSLCLLGLIADQISQLRLGLFDLRRRGDGE